ncbi:FAD-dependent oxidoreductase [Kitasatospora sp. NPDC056531]|uniref:FAD-dependent oxidoreductase n=1 Tax=Kitasatospora sp. NPDC056531 TaxID=3345856 RepID=UPI00368768B2
MLRELTDSIRVGADFRRFERLDEGTVRVHLSDGSTAEGDLLVAADGANSGIRRQLLPDFPVTVQDTLPIYGRTPLTDQARDLTPEPALNGFLGVSGPDGRRLALAAQRFGRSPADFGLPAADDYVMWSVAAPAAAYGPGLFGLGAAHLLAKATDTVADWHPSLGALVRLGDLRHLVPASVQISERPALWPPAPVTLVGDAAHPMAPAGISAGAALHDAGLLASRLLPDAPLLDAVRSYERDMLDYGFAAVAAASRNHAG